MVFVCICSSTFRQALTKSSKSGREVYLGILTRISESLSSKPKVAIGQPKENEDIKAIFRKIGEMYTVDPTWHYSDEENFEDLKRRGLRALEFLKTQNKENILVVSHANFIALLAGLMLFGESFPVEISLKLKNFLRLSNTGVCIFSYEDEKWKLKCWNDTSHCLE